MTMATTLASGAGDGPAPSSASTAVTTRASHVLKIDGYSSTLSANRYRSLSSFPFNAGGHIFRAMLSFIYTDTWPEIDQENEAAMAQHLLIAAERYGLDRLKLMCEDRLCNGIIDMGSVTTNLVLAENHYCHSLKKACLELLGSWTTLAEFMATDDFRYLTKSCPGILNDLICIVAARERERTIFFLGE
ncbi:hypothetical protein OsI_33763 [Oryza sativa Indica Group]|uniref:Uncharacterized protein n=1 Tax=Oryza sativa subsp. indica TaxID=39946 RepID=B8BH35_ORYSI|nr:hypothetical protein OsI_33763 [Oryza sativa Indica Group]